MSLLRLTAAQVREIDRLCVESGISIESLMESAGAAVARRVVEIMTPESRVTVICGSGNNGGDGLVAARLLHAGGFQIAVIFEQPAAKTSSAWIANASKLLSLKVKTSPLTHALVRRAKSDLLIDALLGTGLTGKPRIGPAEVIDAMNTTGKPILAIDIPSGLNCDTGEQMGACVRAKNTVTFVAEKKGFANPDAAKYLGEVIVADIGVPREIIDRVVATVR